MENGFAPICVSVAGTDNYYESKRHELMLNEKVLNPIGNRAPLLKDLIYLRFIRAYNKMKGLGTSLPHNPTLKDFFSLEGILFKIKQNPPIFGFTVNQAIELYQAFGVEEIIQNGDGTYFLKEYDLSDGRNMKLWWANWQNMRNERATHKLEDGVYVNRLDPLLKAIGVAYQYLIAQFHMMG